MPQTTPIRLKPRRSVKQRPPHPASSPLVLCDHLIALAQEADRSGYPATASHLVALLDRVFDERPTLR